MADDDDFAVIVNRIEIDVSSRAVWSELSFRCGYGQDDNGARFSIDIMA